MITISSIIQSKLKASPFVLDALNQNLINISELARVWQAEIKQKTKKEVTIEAIAMTIRRTTESIQASSPDPHQTIKPLQTTIRTNLIERTYFKSPTIMRSYKRLTDTVTFNDDTYITMSMGIHEITIISDQTLDKLIEIAFREEQSSTTLDDLAAIILKLPDAVIQTPGSYYTFLGKLFWHNINIEEVVSTAHELSIIVKSDVAHEAFKILNS